MFKSFGNFLYRTPWWALLGGAFLIFLSLVAFATPWGVFNLPKLGRTAAERIAIQHEVDNSGKEILETAFRTWSDNSKDEEQAAELKKVADSIARWREQTPDPVGEANKDALERLDTAQADLKKNQQELEQALREAGAPSQVAKELMGPLKESINKVKDAARDVRKNVLENPIPQASTTVTTPTTTTATTPTTATKPTTETRPTTPSTPAATVKKKQIGITYNFGDDKDAEPNSVNAEFPVIADLNQPSEFAQRLTNLDLDEEAKNTIRAEIRQAGLKILVASVIILFMIPLLIVLSIAKIYIGRARASQIVAEQSKEEARYQTAIRQLSEAKLQALQAQVEPHFLYNTLANVQALTEIDPEAANKMVGHLIEYLRAALPKMRENSSTVGQEIELARAYLNILKMRMGERLSFAIEAPAELLSLPFPPLMLPSLVENAIKHGLEPQREGGSITISVSRQADGALQMDVVDTGRGLTNKGPAVGGGVGLSNIRERLVGLFGAGAYLQLESNPPKGVISRIVIPENALVAKSALGSSFNSSLKTPKLGLLETPPAIIPQPKIADEPQPGWRGMWRKTWRIASKAHGAWARFLRATFVVLLALLAICTVAFVIAVGAGATSIDMFDVRLTGFEGMALAAVAGVAVFIVCALALALLMVILYGTGVFGFLTLIFLLLTTVFSALTPLIPLAVVCVVIYWIIKRGKTKSVTADAVPKDTNL